MTGPALEAALTMARAENLPMPRRIRAVVFDMDGLMFNTEELYPIVGSELLRRRGCELKRELLNRMMGRPAPVALQMMIDEYGLDATVEQLIFETAEIFPSILNTRLQLMPGLSDLLAALEQHALPKGIATSSNRWFTLDVLGRFELVERFKFILTAEDVTHGKPHPEVYLTAAERHGVEPGEILVLEDSQNGCRAAVAAGAVTVAVPGDHSRHHDFSGTHFIADSLADDRLYALLGIARDAS